MSKVFPPRLVVSTRVLRQLLFATDELDTVCEMLPGTDLFVAEPSWNAVESWIYRIVDEMKLRQETAQEMRAIFVSLSNLVTVIPEQFIRPYYSAVDAVSRRENLYQSCALALMLGAPVWVDGTEQQQVETVSFWTLSTGCDG